MQEHNEDALCNRKSLLYELLQGNISLFTGWSLYKRSSEYYVKL